VTKELKSDMQRKIFAYFDGNSPAVSLRDLCFELLTQQRNTWQKLAEAYAALDNVLVRDLHFDGFSVRLQFNPGRIFSSAANLDAEFLKKRSCFLCVEHLPEDQSGILYENEFLVLCNPAPIFPQHYTISSVRHEPQSIEGVLATFLALAEDFGSCFHVIYNGPCCGASAPDHLHFQAFPTGTLPVEDELQDYRKRILVKCHEDVSIYIRGGLGRSLLVVEGNNGVQVKSCLSRIIAAARNFLGVSGEPMMNLVCTYHGGTWCIMIFLRRKHRPDVYFRTDDQKMLISPGAIDMGGFLITPFEKDFMRLDASLMEDIFREVALDEGLVGGIIGSL
jgi:hypothetical protein